MNDAQSIYDLITKLCEKFLNNYQNRLDCTGQFDIKKVRAKCFEIILLKQHSGIGSDVEDISDPYCRLLAWQFQLTAAYNLKEQADKIRLCCEKLEALHAFDNVATTNILLLLLQLRRIPKGSNKIMETALESHYFATNKSSVFTYFEESRFHLPKDCSAVRFDSNQFRLPIKKLSLKSSLMGKVDESRGNNEDVDKLSRVSYTEGNIWELASKEPPNRHRTWESFGCHNTLKEPSFLCESGPEHASWFYCLSAGYHNLITKNYTKASVEIPTEQLVKDLKSLLVGIESKTFKNNDKGEMILTSKICVEGISSAAIKNYCNDFLSCANCYKGLNNLCTPNSFTMKYVHNGYIFSEFCESIKRYLSYYRLAALSMSDTTHLLVFVHGTKLLRNQISILASICKVGPFSEAAPIPHGVALLNYLYQKVMGLTNKDVIMVLYSVLYPCCQVYFNHFLQQWLLQGAIKDSYGEFFITANSKYTMSRGRTYWTRSYTLKEDIIPDFVTDFRSDILYCGKAMNLLKLCMPNSPLCVYLDDKHSNIISCCVTASDLANLELNNHYYYLEATALAGPRMLLSHAIASTRELSHSCHSLIAKKRAATISRIELERQRNVENRLRTKQALIKSLQEEYETAQRRKQIKMEEQLKCEIMATQNDIKMEILQDKIVQEEAKNLIDYYTQLFVQENQKKGFFEKRQFDLHKTNIETADKANTLKETDLVENLDNNNLSNATHSNHTLARSVSSDTFLSTYDDLLQAKSDTSVIDDDMFTDENKPRNIEKLDILNANITFDDVVPMALENFQIAQRNKARVLSTELGRSSNDAILSNNKYNVNQHALTDMQKNRLKAMASEYGTRLKEMSFEKHLDDKQIESGLLTDAQKNKLKMMSGFRNSNIVGMGEEHRAADDNEINSNSIFIENRKLAEKNKEKFMLQELGINRDKKTNRNVQDASYSSLTDAQKNKLKVLSIEFGYDNVKTSTEMAEINRNRMRSSSDCFYGEDIAIQKIRYNENFVNKNVDDNDVNSSNKSEKWTDKKQDKQVKLLLDFTNINIHKNINKVLSIKTSDSEDLIKNPKFELEKISPMSIDSTPISISTTPSSNTFVLFDKSESCNTTATASAVTGYDTGFNFEINKSASLSYLENRKSFYDLGSGVENIIMSKTITAKDAHLVSPNCLKLYLQQSISVPLITQIKLVNNELLKYFIKDLKYLNQLNNLRNYFFLMDGEFGRNITEGLFVKLYSADCPTDLINCHTLQKLVSQSLDYSMKSQETASCLSFRINSLPNVFNLGDPDVLDCISLTYKTSWPLNILFPSETIAKYDEIFKFLLKLRRVSWVLQNLFQDLKSLVKETAKSQTAILIMSPHYRRLHQCRHAMTHFIHTFQSYVVGEVLQSSWKIFEKNLELVTNFDQLYLLHTTYIKNILFMCLLNQKSAPMRKVLQKIFIVILKFYNYIRSCCWLIEDSVYVHPNFRKLEDIFINFEDLTQYLFKVGRRVVKYGYQPHMMQLLDMLDVNNYYSKRKNDKLLSVSISPQ